MKWTKRTPGYKYTKWHKWFAWHPVSVSEHELVWLEFVLRRQSTTVTFGATERFFCIPDYEYKESVFDLIRDGNGNG